MVATVSNADSLLFGLPMIGFLFAGLFRLDELIGRSRKTPMRRTLAGGVDSDGMPIFVEPDGQPLQRLRIGPGKIG
jgi:hypothetical protein